MIRREYLLEKDSGSKSHQDRFLKSLNKSEQKKTVEY